MGAYAGEYNAGDPTDDPNYQPPGTQRQRTCRTCGRVFPNTRVRWDHERDRHGEKRDQYIAARARTEGGRE